MLDSTYAHLPDGQILSQYFAEKQRKRESYYVDRRVWQIQESEDVVRNSLSSPTDLPNLARRASFQFLVQVDADLSPPNECHNAPVIIETSPTIIQSTSPMISARTSNELVGMKLLTIQITGATPSATPLHTPRSPNSIRPSQSHDLIPAAFTPRAKSKMKRANTLFHDSLQLIGPALESNHNTPRLDNPIAESRRRHEFLKTTQRTNDTIPFFPLPSPCIQKHKSSSFFPSTTITK